WPQITPPAHPARQPPYPTAKKFTSGQLRPIDRMRVIANPAAPARHPGTRVMSKTLPRGGVERIRRPRLRLPRSIPIQRVARLFAGANDGDMAGADRIGLFE